MVYVPSISHFNKIYHVEKDLSDHACCSKYDPSAGKSESSASWLRLLVELGLSDPRLWTVVARQTDILPADISAAPAAGSVRFLAHLAAIADDICTIEQHPKGRFVTVIGQASQLTFRDHPVLGSVAMYETYRESPSYARKQVKKTVADYRPVTGIRGLHSIGVMETAGMLHLSHGLVKCRHLGYAVTEGLIQLSFGLLLQRLTSHCTHEHLNDNSSSILFGSRGSYGARRAQGYIYFLLFFTSVPSVVRAFPSSLLKLRAAISEISRLIPAWTSSSNDVVFEISNVVETYGGKFQEIPMAAYTFYILGARARHYSSSAWLEDPPGAGWCTNSMHSDFRKDANDLVYGEEVIQLCIRWASDINVQNKSLRDFLSEDPKQVKEKLLASVYLVDDWLRRRSKDDIICAALFLIQDTTVERELWSSQVSSSAIDSNPRQILVSDQVEMSRWRPMQVMLTYRAILLGALLELSTDTSCLVNESFQDTIVKIL